MNLHLLYTWTLGSLLTLCACGPTFEPEGTPPQPLDCDSYSWYIPNSTTNITPSFTDRAVEDYKGGALTTGFYRSVNSPSALVIQGNQWLLLGSSCARQPTLGTWTTRQNTLTLTNTFSCYYNGDDRPSTDAQTFRYHIEGTKLEFVRLLEGGGEPVLGAVDVYERVSDLCAGDIDALCDGANGCTSCTVVRDSLSNRRGDPTCSTELDTLPVPCDDGEILAAIGVAEARCYTICNLDDPTECAAGETCKDYNVYQLCVTE